MRTKIEKGLTPEQLREFCSRAANLKGTNLKDIQGLAAEYGIDVSLMGARSFKAGPFSEYLTELKSKREMAEAISTVAKHGTGIADAAAVSLSQKIFDDLINGGDAMSIDEKNQYSLALSRLRTGDHRSRFLEAKLQEMQGKLELQQFDAAASAIKYAKELKVIVNDKGLNDRAKTDRVRQILFGFAPDGFTPIATTGDAR